jgi:hypothetical protein
MHKTEELEDNGPKVAEIMEIIANRGAAFRELKDPSAWQREVRQDRPRPDLPNSNNLSSFSSQEPT